MIANLLWQSTHASVLASSVCANQRIVLRKSRRCDARTKKERRGIVDGSEDELKVTLAGARRLARCAGISTRLWEVPQPFLVLSKRCRHRKHLELTLKDLKTAFWRSVAHRSAQGNGCAMLTFVPIHAACSVCQLRT